MSHSYTSLITHIVFATKDRSPRIPAEIRPRLFEYIGGIARANRCALLAASAESDHVHLLIQVHPAMAVADLLREIKSRSSAFVRESFPDADSDGWQNGYGAFAVSRSGVDAVQAYIANQEAHHRRMTFEEEFVALLRRHDVEYDPKYLWS